jgi:hypothetical protein
MSRFDGVRFTSYGMADGLPHGTVNHFVETRSGEYWVSTNGAGVCRFNPAGRRAPASAAAASPRDALFVPYRVGTTAATNRVNIAYEDRQGGLWAGTDDGLFKLDRERGAFERVELPLMPAGLGLRAIFALAEDAEGSLWIGTGGGLTRRLPDGHTVVYRLDPSGPRDIVDVLRFEGDRRLWAGFRSGLLRLDTAPASQFEPATDPIVRRLERPTSRAEALAKAEALQKQASPPRGSRPRTACPTTASPALFFEPQGRIWMGTPRGVVEYDGMKFQLRGAVNGVPVSHVTDIVEDSAGSLWISSFAGVTRLIRRGLVTFDQDDGLPNMPIHSLGEDAPPSARRRRRFPHQPADGRALRHDAAGVAAEHVVYMDVAVRVSRSHRRLVDHESDGLVSMDGWQRCRRPGAPPAGFDLHAAQRPADDDVFSAFEDREATSGLARRQVAFSNGAGPRIAGTSTRTPTACHRSARWATARWRLPRIAPAASGSASTAAPDSCGGAASDSSASRPRAAPRSARSRRCTSTRPAVCGSAPMKPAGAHRRSRRGAAGVYDIRHGARAGEQ